MRKCLLIIILLCVTNQMMQAQEFKDKELASLVNVVKMLRAQNEATYNKALQILKSDQKWTSMNETGALQPNECQHSDKVSKFKLNGLLTKVERGRKYVTTHGDMLNGEDERYNYSLFERTVKAGKTVSFKLKGREGRQAFVIVPFANDKSVLTCSSSIGKFVWSSEAFIAEIDMLLVKEQIITLKIKNETKENQAFVILNHNTRKQ